MRIGPNLLLTVGLSYWKNWGSKTLLPSQQFSCGGGAAASPASGFRAYAVQRNKDEKFTKLIPAAQRSILRC